MRITCQICKSDSTKNPNSSAGIPEKMKVTVTQHPGLPWGKVTLQPDSYSFHWLDPLGWVSLVVAMSVTLGVECVLSCLDEIYFEASHWPCNHIISFQIRSVSEKWKNYNLTKYANGDTIRTRRESQCLPYVGFLVRAPKTLLYIDKFYFFNLLWCVAVVLLFIYWLFIFQV